MLNILLRTAILYLVALFVIRVMGKSELSKLDPFQLVALFMIAELAALPIASPDVAVVTGMAAMLGLLLIQVIFSMLSVKSQGFNTLIKGKATIIIEKGRINEKEMKKFRITIDDLSQQLRLKNYPSIADVDYAILEANGDMSVIPKPDKNPLTRQDLGVPTGAETLPMVVIADGTLYRDNLKRLNLQESVVMNRLAAAGIEDYAQVFLCFIDEKGEIHVHPKAGNSTGAHQNTFGNQGSDLQ